MMKKYKSIIETLDERNKPITPLIFLDDVRLLIGSQMKLGDMVVIKRCNTVERYLIVQSSCTNIGITEFELHIIP